MLAEARFKLPKAVLKSDLFSAEGSYFDKRHKTLKRYTDGYSPNIKKSKKKKSNSNFKTNISNMNPYRCIYKGFIIIFFYILKSH